MDIRAYVAIFAVSLQFGFQPFLNQYLLSPTGIKSIIVIIQEIFKSVCCLVVLIITGELGECLKGLDFHESVRVAALPSIIYSIQNVIAFFAYQNLDPLTFNLINQSKVIFAAIFLYFILNIKQSKRQLIALIILFGVSIMLTLDTATTYTDNSDTTDNIITTTTNNNNCNININNSDTNNIIMDSTSSGNVSCIAEIDNIISASNNANINSLLNDSNLIDEQNDNNILSYDFGSSIGKNETHGLIGVLIASMLSGVAGTLVQKALQSQSKSRHTLLFTTELAFFSLSKKNALVFIFFLYFYFLYVFYILVVFFFCFVLFFVFY